MVAPVAGIVAGKFAASALVGLLLLVQLVPVSHTAELAPVHACAASTCMSMCPGVAEKT